MKFKGRSSLLAFLIMLICLSLRLCVSVADFTFFINKNVTTCRADYWLGTQLCDISRRLWLNSMKEHLLQYLSCPSCAHGIALASAEREGEEIMRGTLSCTSCARSWPIERGVPRFAALESVEAEKAATAAGFGWQWTHFNQDDEKYEQQLLGWIAPVAADFFRNKIVLEGGCCKG